MTQGFPFEKFLKSTPQKEEKTNKNDDLLNSIFNQTQKPSTATSPEKAQPSTVNLSQSEEESALEPILEALYPMIEANMPSIKFDTFIKNKIKLISLSDTKATFETQTQFIKSTLETNYSDFFKKALQELMGSSYTIEFTNSSSPLNSNLKESLQSLSEDKPNPTKETKNFFTLDLTPNQDELKDQAEGRYINHMEKQSSGIVIDPSKTFDNFIVGPSNNLAFATASAVSDSPGKSGKYPCLYLYSDSGLGKTHLLHAVANGIFANHPHMKICLISARDFMKELINAYKDKTLSEFQRKYTESVDVLMIDDIHELKNKTSTQEEFFHIFNFLHDKGKQLIFTSDKSPDKITGIEERIITRLQWGLVVDIQKPDFETRTAILKKKAIELDLFIQDDVLNLIASSIKTSIRELEGNLIRLQAHADIMEAEIDTEMARDILKLQEINERPAATLESVCRASSQYFKIAVPDLRSKSRSKNIVKARHIAWYLSKNIVGATFMEIGKYYSNRDHTSVMHGVNKITEQLKGDSQLSKDLIFLENNI